MQSLKFCSSSGRKYEVSLPSPLKGFASAYLFSFHKSGSTLMDNMIRQYCKPFGIPIFSLFSEAFSAGVPTSEVTEDAAVCFSDHGRIYTGFRHYPAFKLDLTRAQPILLVRDPRDMLVSLYYSVTKSHFIPWNHFKFKKKRKDAAQLNINQYVRQQSRLYRVTFRRYQKMLPAETLVTYRYEDIIYEKAAWLKDMVKVLKLPYDADRIAETASEFDIFPEKEDQHKHIRQVHPGNFRKQLEQETIDILNNDLHDFLRYYNYS